MVIMRGATPQTTPEDILYASAFSPYGAVYSMHIIPRNHPVYYFGINRNSTARALRVGNKHKRNDGTPGPS